MTGKEWLVLVISLGVSCVLMLTAVLIAVAVGW